MSLLRPAGPNPEVAQLPATIRAHCHMLGWRVIPIYPYTKPRAQRWHIQVPTASPGCKRVFFIDGTNWFTWRAAFKRGCAKPGEVEVNLHGNGY